MGWIGSIRCEKFQNDFMAQTCALNAPFQPVLHRGSCSNETLPNAPNTTRRTKTWVLGPTGWIGCIRCKKFWCDLVARTFPLIAPVQPVLQLASCSNDIIRNTPKHYETHQNRSFGSNGMDRVHSFRKIPLLLRGTNFCIKCTSSSLFASSFVQ